MIFLILLLLSVFVILFTIGVWIVISYHFKRFGFKKDPRVKIILKIFSFGTIILIGINALLLLLIKIKLP